MEAPCTGVGCAPEPPGKGGTAGRGRLGSPAAARLGDKAVNAAHRMNGAKLPYAAWLLDAKNEVAS